MILFLLGIHILPCHHSHRHTVPMVYVETFSVPILDPFPIRQMYLETTGEPTRGAAEPLPRTAMVAHSTRKEVCFYLFALVYFSQYMLEK